MYWRFIISFFILFFLYIIQVGFIQFLPFSLYNLNLIIIVLVFVLVLADIDLSMFSWIVIAFLLELFSFYWPGFYFLTFALNFLILYWLIYNFLTNRSLYSFLILGSIALLVNDFSLLLFNHWQEINSLFLLQEIKRLLYNNILIIVFFYILNLASYRFKPILKK